MHMGMVMLARIPFRSSNWEIYATMRRGDDAHVNGGDQVCVRHRRK